MTISKYDVFIEKCKRSFHFMFMQLSCLSEGSKLEDNWHVRYMCDSLQCLYLECDKDGLQYYKDGLEIPQFHKTKINTLFICIPPRHTKTMILCLFNLWVWLNNPREDFVSVSCSNSLAKDSNTVFNRVYTNEDFKKIYPYLFSGKIKNLEKTGATEIHNSHGGKRIALSWQQSVVGKGGNIIVIDDPHEYNDGYKIVSKANEFYSQKLTTRNKRGKSKMVVCMQRLFTYDLVAHMYKPGHETHCMLKFPAEYEGDSKPNRMGFSDPRTNIGDILFPLQKDMYKNLKEELNPESWSSQFQQEPIERSEVGLTHADLDFVNIIIPGNTINRDHPDKYVKMDFDRYYTAWDLGIISDPNDPDCRNSYNAGVLLGEKSGHVYVIDAIYFKGDFVVILNTFKSYIEKWGLNFDGHIVEKKASAESLLAVLRNENYGQPVVLRDVKTSKIERLEAITPMFKKGAIHINRFFCTPCYQNGKLDQNACMTFVNELLAFPSGKIADLIDALTIGVNYIIHKEVTNVNTNSSNLSQQKMIKKKRRSLHGR